MYAIQNFILDGTYFLREFVKISIVSIINDYNGQRVDKVLTIMINNSDF